MGEILIPFALNKSGEVVGIDSVANGLACNCICISCKSPMVARHGQYNQPHFSHLKAGTADLKCDITFENSVLWMARDIFSNTLSLNLLTPELKSEYDHATLVTKEGVRHLDLSSVEFLPKLQTPKLTLIVDVVQGDVRRPLAITMAFGAMLACTEGVQHKGALISHLQICLDELHDAWRGMRTGFKESLSDFLLKTPGNRRWLFHERSQVVFKKLDQENVARLKEMRKSRPAPEYRAPENRRPESSTGYTERERSALNQLLWELEREKRKFR